VSKLSHRLSRAIGAGRRSATYRSSREAILAALLGKRAMAHRAGLHSLEKQLRSHILWALPMRSPKDGSEQEEIEDNDEPSSL
jgi:hypothetical protein